MDNQHYMGVASREDCRTLCKLAEDCNFFVHQSNEQKCSLKYGIGEKKKTDQRSNYVFGSKNCAEEGTGQDIPDDPKSEKPLSAAVPALVIGGLLALLGTAVVSALITAIVCRFKKKKRSEQRTPKVEINADYGFYYSTAGNYLNQLFIS